MCQHLAFFKAFTLSTAIFLNLDFPITVLSIDSRSIKATTLQNKRLSSMVFCLA